MPGAQRGSGDVPRARGSVGRWAAGRDGALADSPRLSLAASQGTAQPGAGHQGGLGRVGSMLAPASARGPVYALDTGAQRRSWDSLWLPPVHCSLPLLLPTSLTPSPNRPQLQAAPAPLPQTPAPSHPALLSPFFSHLFQTVAVAIILVLALLAFQHMMKRDVPTDVDTAERMRQREQDLNQQMARLLEEMERRRAAEEATLLSVLGVWVGPC